MGSSKEEREAKMREQQEREKAAAAAAAKVADLAVARAPGYKALEARETWLGSAEMAKALSSAFKTMTFSASFTDGYGSVVPAPRRPRLDHHTPELLDSVERAIEAGAPDPARCEHAQFFFPPQEEIETYARGYLKGYQDAFQAGKEAAKKEAAERRSREDEFHGCPPFPMHPFFGPPRRHW